MKRLIGPLLVASLFSALAVMPSQAGAQDGATCMGELVTINMKDGASGIGTNGKDVILGTGKGDVIDGRGGNDVICSGNGNDRVSGGNGDDIVRAGDDKDRVYGGNGNDTLYGGDGPDIIYGDDGNDILRGDDDDDRIEGGDGVDDLSGGDGDDLIRAGAGADILRGGWGDDILSGNDGDDETIAGPGDDYLRGGDGDDILRGGTGLDVLKGGPGADEFFPGSDETEPEPEPEPEPTPAPTPGPAPGPNPALTTVFQEDFRQESSLDRFNWQNHTGSENDGTPDTWQGDHNLDCGSPGTTRTIHKPSPGDLTDVGETAYWCAPGGDANKAHLMTSMDTGGYEHIDFSPAESFSSVSRVCWAQNMNNLGRKWTQVAIVSEASFFANDQRLDYIVPRLDGDMGSFGAPGSAGVFVTGDDFLYAMPGGSTEVWTGQSQDVDWRGFSTLDKARRHTTCLEDLENGTIRVELERESSIEVRILEGAMPEGAVRVIFQDVTYNGTKDPSPFSDPFTWHWDNLLIESR